MKKVNTMGFWITFAFGATFAYFVWLSWNKLTELIGNSTTVWIITGIIVLLGILIGKLSFSKLAKRFT